MTDRYEHEWTCTIGTELYCSYCGVDEQHANGECSARLRTALEACARERDEALVKLARLSVAPVYTLERIIELTKACYDDGVAASSERIIAWLFTYDEDSVHDKIAREIAQRIQRGQHLEEL